MSEMARPMRAAIVVPVYGQADLMGETLSDLLGQQGGAQHEIRLVLVDDTCPDPRTRRKSEIFAAAHPGRVLYWRAPSNRGLSAMRNEGVRRALEIWPDLDAVAFVDGDDRVFARFVARGLDRLAEHGGQPTRDGGRVGWIYEDWHQFGTPEALHAPAPFQPLFALAACQHTPGCFCLAQMFRDGVWFDETRRGGDAEDWQFWVNAYAQGWRGRHVPAIGFRYRSRLGGLAFEGRQAGERNRMRIQSEFPDLFHPDAYLAHERMGAMARYLQLVAPGVAQLDGAGSEAPRPVGMDRVADWLARVIQLPTARAPAHAMIFTGTAHAALEAAGLLGWAGWFLEARAPDRVSTLTLGAAAGESHQLARETSSAPLAGSAVISLPFLTLANALARGRGLADLIGGEGAHHYALALATGGQGPVHAAGQGAGIADHQGAFDAALGPLDQPHHPWRTDPLWRPYGANRAQLDHIHLGFKVPLCDRRARMATLLIAESADLELRADDLGLAEIAAHYARRDGVAPALCVLGPRLPAGVVHRAGVGAVFLAPPFDSAVPGPAREGLLAAFGTIVTLDSPAPVAALNAVRRFGCTAVAALPRATREGSALLEALPTSFKGFRTVLIRHEDQAARLAALGVARERIGRDLLADAQERETQDP